MITALALAAMTSLVDDVATNPKDAHPITVGTSVPDSPLKTMDGATTSLHAVLAGRKAVLVFYRGSWCPFCNRHLADLNGIEANLKADGGQLIAISPDRPEDLRKMLDKNQLGFRLFSDSKAEALKKFGVAFRVDDGTYTTYRDKYKLDLEVASGQTHHILPVPSVFVIDASGKVVFAHSDPDYKARLSAKAVLEAATRAR